MRKMTKEEIAKRKGTPIKKSKPKPKPIPKPTLPTPQPQKVDDRLVEILRTLAARPDPVIQQTQTAPAPAPVEQPVAKRLIINRDEKGLISSIDIEVV